MWINLRIDRVPLPLVRQLLGNNPGTTSRTCRIYVPYNTHSKAISLESLYPANDSVRRELGVFWDKHNFTTVTIPVEAFREKIDEQTIEGFVPKLSLRRWGVQGGVPSMRRRLKEGEESSSNEEGTRIQMDLSQSVMPAERDMLDPYNRPQLFTPEEEGRITIRTSSPASIRGRNTQIIWDESVFPSEDILRQTDSVRQRWTRERERMEAEDIVPRYNMP